MSTLHELMVHAVIGKGFKCDYTDEGQMEKRGLARFTGNQHNEKWDWNKDALDRLPTTELVKLYERF